LRLWLKRPARLVLILQGPSPSCAEVGRLRAHGERGTNRVPFTGRIRKRTLAPGVYRITVVAVRGTTRTVIGTTQIAVGSSAPNPAAARFACLSAPSPAALPFLGALLAPPGPGSAPPAVSSPGPTGEESLPTEGAKGAVATRNKPIIPPLPAIPRPSLPDMATGLPHAVGVALLLFALFAFAGMSVLLVRYVRGSWNP